MNNRIVLHAYMHGGDYYMPTVGNLGGTLPPVGKSAGFSMVLTKEGVLINSKGTEALMPLSCFKLLVLAPEDKFVPTEEGNDYGKIVKAKK